MKVMIPISSLRRAMVHLDAAVPARTPLAVLQCLAISVLPTATTIRATNQKLQVRATFRDAEPTEVGTALIPLGVGLDKLNEDPEAKQRPGLVSLTAVHRDGTVTFETTGEGQVTVTVVPAEGSRRRKQTITLRCPTEWELFPEWPTGDNFAVHGWYHVPAGKLARMCTATAAATNLDKSPMYAFGGAKIETSFDQTRNLAATTPALMHLIGYNGDLLIVMSSAVRADEHAACPKGPELSVIPKHMLHAIARLANAADPDDDVDLGFSFANPLLPTAAWARCGDVTVQSSMLAGRAAPWRQQLPTDDPVARFKMTAQDLYVALRLASIPLDEHTREIVIELVPRPATDPRPSQLTLWTESPTGGWGMNDLCMPTASGLASWAAVRAADMHAALTAFRPDQDVEVEFHARKLVVAADGGRVMVTTAVSPLRPLSSELQAVAPA